MTQGLQLVRKASATVGVFKTSSNETRPAAECARPYNKHCPMKQGLQLMRKASATVGGYDYPFPRGPFLWPEECSCIDHGSEIPQVKVANPSPTPLLNPRGRTQHKNTSSRGGRGCTLYRLNAGSIRPGRVECDARRSRRGRIRWKV